MALRHSTVRVLSLAVVAVVAISPTIVRADPAGAAAAVAPDFKPYVGAITGDDVYVRSGPTEGFYATSKLNKGDRVTVVGVRGLENDYLKVVPPDGSYCFVARSFVELDPGSTTAGKVTRSDLIVRAGSTLNSKKNTMLMKLDAGDAVQLVGTQDDDKYYKIAPPPGAYLYVKRSLVSPVPNAAPVSIPLVAQANEHDPIVSDPTVTSSAPAKGNAVTPPVTAVPPAAEPTKPVSSTPAPASATVVTAAPAVTPAPVAAAPVTPPAVAVVAPTTKPAVDDPAVASAKVAAPATTRPTVVARAAPTTKPTLTAREQFERAETEFAKLSTEPLDRQPLAGLKWRYGSLARDGTLPVSLRQVAAGRQSTLALRIEAKKQLEESNRVAVEAAAKQRALTAEQVELAQRVKDQEVTTYAAVGTLRISSLQQSGATLYRLTDPSSGRTLIYLRSNDPKYAGLLNQFIGVRGSITQDAALSLRYVTPTEAEAIDPAKVNNGISAVVTPPSLVNRGATASLGGN